MQEKSGHSKDWAGVVLAMFAANEWADMPKFIKEDHMHETQLIEARKPTQQSCAGSGYESGDIPTLLKMERS